MNHEKIKNAFFLTATILCGGIVGLVGIKFLLPVLLPFLISYTIATLTTTPAIILEKRTCAPRSKLRLFISLFALLVLSLAIFGIGRYAALTLWQVASSLLEGDRLSGFIENLLKSLESLPGKELPIDLEGEITDAIRGLLTTIASTLASLLGSVVGMLPKIFLFLVATFISLVYFSLDLEGLNEKMRAAIPKEWIGPLSMVKGRLLSVGVRYVFSYFLIMLITFSVMLTGFLIMRISHPVLIALMIAFFDLFPIIGVGTAVIPWAIVELILGNTARGIGLLVLFVLNELVRQFAEPKILGKSLNVHPLITLVLIYTSISLFGFVGILLIPILVSVFSFALQKE